MNMNLKQTFHSVSKHVLKNIETIVTSRLKYLAILIKGRLIGVFFFNIFFYFLLTLHQLISSLQTMLKCCHNVTCVKCIIGLGKGREVKANIIGQQDDDVSQEF